MKILVDEKYFNLEKELETLKPKIEFEKIIDKNISQIKNSGISKSYFDFYVFDLREDVAQSAEIISEIKKYNPSIKTIAFTSKKNGRYQGTFFFRGVDLFLFKETDKEFLLNYLKKAHIRLSKSS
ncbi:MAG: hypothetical protein Fur0015_14800 [Ignavibacteriales bacterium]